MKHDPLSGIQLGPGVTQGAVTLVREALILDSTHGLQVSVVSIDTHLRDRMELMRVPGTATISKMLAFDHSTGRIFAGTSEGIWEPSLGIIAPTLSPREYFHWLLELSPDRSKIYTLAKEQLHVVDIASKRIERSFPVPPWAAGIQVSAALGMVVCPHAVGGPQVLDLEGKVLSKLEREGFSEASIRSDGIVALAGDGPGVWTWDWTAGTCTLLTEVGRAPAWNGSSLYFMKQPNALWRIDGDDAQPICELAHLTDDENDLRSARGWFRQPFISRDGRFVLALLAVAGKRMWHVGAMYEVATRRVMLVPNFYAYNISWVT